MEVETTDPAKRHPGGGAHPAGAATEHPEAGPIRAWVLRHDDSALFLVVYIGLAVALSLVSLFWLIAVVLVHFAFEIIKHAHMMDGFGPILGSSLWELKLDFALVLFALGLSLYMDVLFGILGIGGIAARAGGQAARAGSRFAAWPRIIRSVLLTLDDVFLILRGVFSKKARAARRAAKAAKAGPAEASAGDEKTDAPPGAPADPAALRPAPPAWQSRWGVGDWAAVVFGSSCLLLIIGAPYLTDHSFHTAFETLVEELRPVP